MEQFNKKIKLPEKQQITFITGNSKKLEEFNNIMKQFNLDDKYFINSYKLDLPELQGADYSEIVKAKCKYATELIDGSIIIEDSGLSFNSLNGLPGPYIKWFLDKIGNEGLYKMSNGFDNKTAKAYCIFAYTKGKNKEIYLFNGTVEGQIVSPKGENGFGWDAIFQPDGENETFGEMDPKKKNELSPRKKAIEILATFLSNLYIL